MPYPYQNSASHSFIPEIWAAELLTQFDPLLVWSSNLVSNNKYEGTISKKGDVVHINSLLRPSVGDYKLSDGMTAQRPETVDQKLPITEAKYLQILMENSERLQSAGDLSSPINQQMIRSLAREADTFMGNLITSHATPMPALKPDATNLPQALYSGILDMMLALDEEDIPGGRYAVVSPRVKRYLVEHPAVANAGAYGEGGVTANGVVARLAGFTILSTTAMPTGSDIVAGHSEFATFASQFTEFRVGQSEKYRADYIDTLHLYGGKIVRFPGMDTKQGSIFDESLPTKGIVKASVTWPKAA